MAVGASRKYLLGDYCLEPEKRLLSLAGKPVRLTARPFQVLVYLIENQDRVVGRDELLDRFWEGSDVYGDSLSKCVGAIRKAFNDRSESPRFIETRYSEGYRYVGPVEEQFIRNQPSMLEMGPSDPYSVAIEEDVAPLAAPPPQMADQGELYGPIRPPVPPAHISAARSRYRVLIPALMVVAIVLASVAAISYSRRPKLSDNAAFPIRSIAVLPFKNLTGDPSQDYFSDGLTENFITELAKIDGLKVISRSSVFTLKDKEVDPQDAGRKLGVAAVLEGSVARSGDTVRVEVRLVSSGDGRVLWESGARDRSLKDIFQIEDSITSDVVGQIKGRISDQHAPITRDTTSVAAYEEYLRGRFFINNQYQDLQTTGPEENLSKAAQHFQNALKVDPNYAAAYAGLADAQTSLVWFSTTDTRALIKSAKEAALTAVRIDDALPEAHTALATVYIHEWSFEDARQSCLRALALDPDSALAHDVYAAYLMAEGRANEMLEQIERAKELDPLNVFIIADRASLLYMARRYDESIRESRNADELQPDSGLAGNVAQCYLAEGKYNEAISEFERIRAANTVKGLKPAFTAWVAVAYAMAGKKDRARALLGELTQMAKTQYVPKTFYAYIDAAVGDKDAAFQMLDAAFAEHDSTLIGLTTHPWFDPLRADPRFDSLVRRVGLK
ncbi:MAG TPA: winged helix-turn-helix domain-containing protein [Blastocatellia bacterium]